MPFPEVYGGMEQKAIDGQENPVAVIASSKFYEVQKHIVLTGHIVDHLNTVVAGALWKKLSDADKKIFTDVALEAAAKASKEVAAREGELAAIFRSKGVSVTDVNTNEFRDTVLKNVPFEQFGYQKADWDRIQAIK
jgi:TRAP-type C4-dicarboxylate transport system substrate-binding protein